MCCEVRYLWPERKKCINSGPSQDRSLDIYCLFVNPVCCQDGNPGKEGSEGPPGEEGPAGPPGGTTIVCLAAFSRTHMLALVPRIPQIAPLHSSFVLRIGSFLVPRPLGKNCIFPSLQTRMACSQRGRVSTTLMQPSIKEMLRA